MLLATQQVNTCSKLTLKTLHLPISRQYFISIPPEDVKKPLVFGRFQGL